MVLSLAACGGTNTADPSSSGSESSASGSSSEAAGDDPILTGEKPELKVLSMYQAYDYEEQPAWKITEELTGYKTKWYALPADNADQKLLLEEGIRQTEAFASLTARITTCCSGSPRTSTHSFRSRTR